jgi:hypothetical protein
MPRFCITGETRAWRCASNSKLRTCYVGNNAWAPDAMPVPMAVFEIQLTLA